MRHLASPCAPHHGAARAIAWLWLVVALAAPHGALQAQEAGAPSVRWWHGALAVGGVGLLVLVDEPITEALQGNPSTSAGVAGVARRLGQPEVYLSVAGGVVLAGLVADRPEVTRAGGRIAASLALAGAATNIAKLGLGRGRPNEGYDADDWDPLSGRTSMPSGHTAMAFALATALADEIDNGWASVGLYAAATATGWSRIHHRRHWLSDVVAGAAVGVVSAKLAGGRWRVFGLRAPAVLVGPAAAAVAWRVEF